MGQELFPICPRGGQTIQSVTKFWLKYRTGKYKKEVILIEPLPFYHNPIYNHISLTYQMQG